LWEKRRENLSPVDVAVSPDGRFLAVAGAAGGSNKPGIYRFLGVFLCDLKANPPEVRPLADEGGEIGRCVAFPPDGRTLACGAPDGAIELWNYKEGFRIGRFDRRHTRNVDRLVFNADGSRLVSAAYAETVRIWDIAERKQIRILQSYPAEIPFND